MVRVNLQALAFWTVFVAALAVATVEAAVVLHFAAKYW